MRVRLAQFVLLFVLQLFPYSLYQQRRAEVGHKNVMLPPPTKQKAKRSGGLHGFKL